MEESRDEEKQVEAAVREPNANATLARAFMENVGTLVEGAKKFYEQNKEGIEVMSRFGEVYKEELENLDATHKQALQVLNRYGWFLTPSSLPHLLIFPIAHIGNAGDQGHAINELFVKHFTSNDFEQLEGLVKRWAKNPVFDSRMHIFKDCLASLRNATDGHNPSNVVIPPLISQIDGILTVYRVRWGFHYDKKKRKWKDDSGKPITGDKKKLFEEHSQGMFLNEALISLAISSLFDKLFENTLTFEPVSSDFNRHKIMHGEDVSYGSMINTVRAFMYLDFLAHLKD